MVTYRSGLMSPLLFALAFVFSVAFVEAQGLPMRDVIEVRLIERDVKQLADRLQLSEDQRVIIASLYEEYETALRGVGESIIAQGLRAVGLTPSAGEDEMRNAIQGLSREQQAKLVEAMQSARRAGRGESDRLREELLENMRALLTEEQAKGWESAARAMRRDVILNLRMDPEGPNSHVNLGLRSDLMRIIDRERRATTEGGERGSLWMLLGDMPLANVPEPFLEIRQRAAEIVERHEHELDVLLQSGVVLAEEDDRQAMRTAAQRGEADRIRALHNRIMQSGVTRTVLRMNERTAEQLAGLLRELGDIRSAERWEWAVNLVHYPEIYGNDIAAFMIDWMREQLGKESPLIETVNGIDAEFQRQRKTILAEIAREDLRIREQIPMMMMEVGKPEMFERWERLRTDFETIKTETLAKLKAIAPTEIAARFDRTAEQNRPHVEGGSINTIQVMQFRVNRGGGSDRMPDRRN